MKKETDRSHAAITSDDIDILQKESDKAFAICLKLNGEEDFARAAASLIDDRYRGTIYKAEHILMGDIAKVFNDFAGLYSSGDLPSKAKFVLIYLYERCQGKDLGKTYDINALNQLITTKNFDRNVSIVRETSFFKPIDDIKDEFALPSILSKIKSEQLLAIASFIHRIASLIAKADNKISAKEKELLKQVSNKANNPKVAVPKAQYNEIPENDTLEIVLQELHELIGLEEVKKNVEDLTNFLKVQKLREGKGLKTTNNSLHTVFMGPPGTGKTTVARMLGRIYKHLGFLEKGHLVETDRTGMVAGYVGQTAIKSDEIIKAAQGGVLFIDEAYSLASGGFNDFGNEAIEILLKRMEDYRRDMVVVVAGYPDEMQGFIQSNPGIQSRFNRYFNFDHYSADALLKIFNLFAKKADFVLTEDAEGKLTEILERVHEKRNKSFGNARVTRNLFEKIIERQANRIVSVTPITEELLITLTEDDIPEILKTVREIILFEEDEE